MEQKELMSTENTEEVRENDTVAGVSAPDVPENTVDAAAASADDAPAVSDSSPRGQEDIYSYDADDEPVNDKDFYADYDAECAVHKAEAKEQGQAAPAESAQDTPFVNALTKENAEKALESSNVHARAENEQSIKDAPEKRIELTNAEVTGANRVKVNRVYVLNTVISMVTLCIVAASMFIGYAYLKNFEDKLDIGINSIERSGDSSGEDGNGTPSGSDEDEAVDAISIIYDGPDTETSETSDNVIDIESGKILIYDSYVGYGWVPVLADVKKNTYRKEDFSVDDNYRMKYVADGELSSYFGIDVSSFQGDIDWNAVRSDGVEFAILRIGVRGYGEEGNIKLDDKFVQNYDAAHKAGIDLGVYFYSQAISVDEAVEEAKFVLEQLDGRTLEYPVVFDWEPVDPGTAEVPPRTEDLMPGTLTMSAIAFCETIKDAGYKAMIYTGKKLAYLKYDMRMLQDYPVWLALYSTDMTYYYDFDMWQYGFGRVDGIEGDVDLNIAIIR